MSNKNNFEFWIERHEGNEAIITEAEGLFINTLIREIYVTDEQLKQEIRC